MRVLSRSWIAWVGAAVLSAQAGATRAQDASAEMTSAEEAAVERAEFEARRAKAEFEEADYKKKLAALDLPASDFEPEKAGVTLKDKAGYFGELISFYTLTEAAGLFLDESAEKGKLDPSQPVVLTTDFELARIGSLWTVVRERADAFDEQLDGLAKAGVSSKLVGPKLTPLDVAGSVLGAAADVASFFRLKREISGRVITPSNEALLVSTASRLSEREEPYEVVIPSMSLARKSWFAEWLAKARQAESRARAKRAELEARIAPATLPTRIADQAKRVERLEEGTPERAAAERVLRSLRLEWELWSRYDKTFETVLSEFEDFVETMTTRPKGAGSSPLEELFFMDAVEQSGSDVRILALRVVSQGGDVETSSGALRSTKVSYVGGAVCLFVLMDREGTVLRADSIPIVGSKSFRGRIRTAPPQRLEAASFE